MIGLWRQVERIHKSGMYMMLDWTRERDCAPENAAGWLAVWQKDEPQAVFCLAETKPKATKR